MINLLVFKEDEIIINFYVFSYKFGVIKYILLDLKWYIF